MVHNTMNRAGMKIPKSVWMFVEGPCGKFNRDITPASADDENTPYHSTRHHCVVLACRQYDDGFPLLHTQPIPKISVMICQHHAPFSRWSVSAARPSCPPRRRPRRGAEGPSVTSSRVTILRKRLLPPLAGCCRYLCLTMCT